MLRKRCHQHLTGDLSRRGTISGSAVVRCFIHKNRERGKAWGRALVTPLPSMTQNTGTVTGHHASEITDVFLQLLWHPVLIGEIGFHTGAVRSDLKWRLHKRTRAVVVVNP